MMDKQLIDLAVKYCEGKKHVKPYDVLAVIEHESGGVPIFHATDHQFRDNLAAAQRITGLAAEQIIKAATISNGANQGQVGKFRCEPGYFTWAQQFKQFKPTERFLLSCSFGVGQKMMRWLVSGQPQGDWITAIEQFMGSLPTQVMYCAGDLESLMRAYPDDKSVAFTCYNAGHALKAHFWQQAHANYGTPVAKRAEQFKAILEHEYDII